MVIIHPIRTPSKFEVYSTKVRGSIPAEVITFYVAAHAALRSATADSAWLYWLVFLGALIAAPLYLRFTYKVRSSVHLVVWTGAFVVWAFALGNQPFETISWYKPLYGQIALPLYSLLVAPLLVKDQS